MAGLAGLGAAPAGALDFVYLVRHAEKADPWPKERDLDAFWPLSPAGAARAAALGARLEKAGISAVYTSRTTRTISTGMPLATRARISIAADDATIHTADMAGLLARLREIHAADAAVLIVGHSNTIPHLLVRLGAVPECYTRLGITDGPDGLLIDGYDGLWKVDLRRQGCDALARE
ncbi:MAG: histidine phosphatase family protein [Acidobacteriota bacterium]